MGETFFDLFKINFSFVLNYDSGKVLFHHTQNVCCIILSNTLLVQNHMG